MKTPHCSRLGTALVAVALLLMSSLASAANVAGKVLFMRGDVTIAAEDAQPRKALRNMPIHEGERIITGNNGVVQLLLTDGAMMSLRANSEYRIEKQDTGEAEGSTMEQAGELLSGWMRMVTGAIGKANPNAVKQSTVVATIGIRGTVFQVIHVPEGGLPGMPDLAPGTYLFLEEGEVDIFGDNGSRNVTAGQVIFVPQGTRAPQLAPEMLRLFDIAGDEATRFETLADYEGELDLRETRDNLNDLLDGFLPNDFQVSGWVYNDSLYGGTFAVGPEFSLGNVYATEIITAGSGSSRALKELVYYDLAKAGSGFVLEATDVTGLLDHDAIAISGSESMSVGVWAEGAWSWYGFDTVQGIVEPPTLGTDKWTWVIGDNALGPDASLFSFLKGTFEYKLGVATGLYDATGALAGNVLDMRVIANFGTQYIDVKADTENLAQLPFKFSGSGDFASLYNGGVLLIDSSFSNSGFFSGSFFGQSAGGLGGILELDFDEGSGTPNVVTGAVALNRGLSAIPGIGTWITSGPSYDGPVIYPEAISPKKGDTLITSGIGINRLLEGGVSIDNQGVEHVLQVTNTTSGLLESDGARLLPLTEFISVGVWDAASYAYQLDGVTQSPTGQNWIWVLGDNIIAPDEVNYFGDFLIGNYRFNLAAQTGLYDISGTHQADITSMMAMVDFGQQSIDIQMIVDALNAAHFEYGGQGTFGDLYTGGIFLNEWWWGNAGGNFIGSFYGSDASGLGGIVEVDITEAFNPTTPSYVSGAVALVRDPRANVGVLAVVIQNDLVSIPLVGSGKTDQDYEADFVNGQHRVTSANVDTCGEGCLLNFEKTTTSTLAFAGNYAVNTDTRIDWGVWTTGINIDGNAAEVGSNAHYMIANNVIVDSTTIASLASSAGLTGTVGYSYRGGTPLMNAIGVTPVNITGGSIQVDFSGLTMAVDMATDSATWGNLQASGSIDNFYNGGLSISDTNSAVAYGAIDGAFVGNNLEGIVSTVSVTDQLSYDTFAGTAAFARP